MSDQEASISIEGLDPANWVRKHRRKLIAAAVEALATEPLTGSEDPARRDDLELRWIIGHNVDLFTRVLETGELNLPESVTSDLVASAARRASEGSPVEALLHDYQVAVQALWRVMAERVRPEEMAGLIELTATVFNYLSATTTLVLRGFAHESTRIDAGERDARFTVYSALLRGDAAEVVARRAGLRLGRFYGVLKVHLPPIEEAPSEPTRGRNAVRSPQVENHRRANTVQRILEEFADGDVLALVVDQSGTALVPVDAESETDVRDRCRRIGDALAAELGGLVYVAAEAAAPAEVPRAADTATEVLRIVRALSYDPGLYFLDDVAVVYQLTRPGPARSLLERRLRVLDDHPDWEETVHSYVANGFDRRATAQALFVHPNTVDYRLSKLASACGVDASDPSQRALVLAALAVRSIDEQVSATPSAPL